MAKKQGSVVSAMVWMFVLSILLFWLPVAGPLVAGFVGGRKAGSLGNALLAVFLPAIVLGVATFFLASVLTGLPLIGALAGAGGVTLGLVHVGPMLVGAIVGAVL
jgi:hypothetical protein